MQVPQRSSRKGARFLLAGFICCLASLFLVFLPTHSSSQQKNEVRIGVLAKRGETKCLEMWGPTAAYLTAKLPRYHFSIVPLSFTEIYGAVQKNEVDFVLANSAIYVELEALYGANRILTLKNRRHEGAYTVFGGVILVRADRSDIDTLRDLKGRSFMAVKENSFGGWIMAWRELVEAGIDPSADLSELMFGGTHDAVVYAVRDGDADAGTVRTDTLERMQKEGKIDINVFRVIHEHGNGTSRGNHHTDFPFMHSTRLYPEWPIAKVKHTSDELAKQVAIALLQMPEHSRATKAAAIAGWLPPLDYQPVHECLKELKISPYQYLGQISLAEVLKRYRYAILFALLALATTTGAAVYVQKLNRKLRDSNREVAMARDDLEVRVKARTSDLEKANMDLLQEVAERERAEEFTKNILETIGEGLIVVDERYRILSVNEAARQQANLPADRILGRYCYEIFHHLERPCAEVGLECAVKHTFETGQPRTIVHVHHDSKNEPVYVEMRSYPMRDRDGKVASVIETLNDVTEKRKLESQLLHASKMEAVGQLAGGVAHDFNNILTAVMGYASMLQMKLNDDKLLQGYVGQIIASTDRAAHLTRSLLAFSRKQVINPRPSRLSEIIKRVESLLERIIGEDIELRIFPADREISVLADPGQIEQILMNLATNARDAMPEGGVLMIETELVSLDDEYVRAHTFAKPGSYMLVTVTDTGEGMDESTKTKIFEPFFTTKEVGRGTGLGLSIVYGIVKQHNGYLNVYSEPGKGTTFRIYLPTVEQEAQRIEEPLPLPVAGGTETILFAEDDDSVRELAQKILEEHGYRVLLAKDGEQALELFRANADRVALLVLDVIMPKRNGREVYDAVRAGQPLARALFLSGYTADIIHRKGMLDREIDFLSKPFSPNALLRKVRELLDRPEVV